MQVVQFSPEKLQAGGGSGFGLFITKSIVDLHEGTIGVYSAGEGKGTRFTLELPMCRTTAITTTRSNPAANLGDTMQQQPQQQLAATTTRSASATRHAATTHHQPFATLPIAEAARIRQSDSRLTAATSSAPAAMHTLGQQQHAPPAVIDPPRCPPAAAAPPRPIAVDPRLDAVRFLALNDQLTGGQASSHSRSGSPHSVVFPPGGRKGSLMLRELARRDALNPQSGSVSYSVASGCKRALYLGSPPVSLHDRHTVDISAEVHSINSDASVILGGDALAAPVMATGAEHDSAEPGVHVAVLPKWDILVVDDSPLNRKMLIKTLRAAGHTCEEAGNGRECVDMVQWRVDNGATPYDVILMDFVMPVMDGPTATKTLRTAKELQYTGPIIGLTGNAMPADINHFMAHGKQQTIFVNVYPVCSDVLILRMLVCLPVRGSACCCCCCCCC